MDDCVNISVTHRANYLIFWHFILDGPSASKNAPVLTSDIGGKTVLVLEHKFVLP